MAADGRGQVRRLTGLLQVHRVMIISAIALCAVFFVREIAIAVRGDGGGVTIALAALSGAAGIALAFYLRWWLRAKAYR